MDGVDRERRRSRGPRTTGLQQQQLVALVVAAQRTVGPGHFVEVGARHLRGEIIMDGRGGTAPEHVVAERRGTLAVSHRPDCCLLGAQKTNGTRSLAYPDEGGYSLQSRQIRPIVVDPGLYLSSRTDIFYATQKRELPNAYKLFTGSSSVILSRKFIEYCIIGTDNLPRTMLMYYTNMPLPHRKYFQTVLCNSPEFNRTVVNHDLHYSKWDSSSKKEPLLLTLDDVENMTQSGVAFGTRFSMDDPVLNHIDEEILHRQPEEPAPGGWCIGVGDVSPCSVSGNPDVLRPGPAAMKLAKLLAQRLTYRNFYSQQFN
uniref:Uncharacterized protein n=1 Tax=Oryza meridionalis TaxID=40149 RepID=A0A0E0CV60_9ORYZ